MKRIHALTLTIALASCASGRNGDDSGRSGYVSTPGFGNSQNIRIDSSGRVFGEHFEFATTSTGYRGLLRGELTYMESTDGRKIVGSWGGSPIELHIETDGVSLRATGLFAGRLGRLVFDPAELVTSFGRCSMQLSRKDGLQFVGHRACLGDGWIAPATVSLPTECVKLPAHRQVMLLATLLTI